MSEITIRPYQLSDVDDFMKWACNSEVLQFIKMQFWVSVNSSREQVVSYFEEVVMPHSCYQAICLDGQAIGQVILTKPDSKHSVDRGRAEISYALGREYWGRGITPAALRMALSSAFQMHPNLIRIQAFVLTENKASQRVLEKVGFVKEGVLRKYVMVEDGVGIDHSIFSILSTDPILY